MRYDAFERLTLAVGGIAVASTVVAGLRQQPILEEIVAQVLLMIVLVGAVHWGRNGGFVTALAAILVYVVMRIPLLMDEGFTTGILEMVAIRTATFGIVGILGGELCTRIRYIFASMEDANSLDHVTRVFNERFIGCRLQKALAEHERYGNHVSLVLLTLDPGLYQPLRKIKQRSVLRSVAGHVRNDVRIVDDVGRLNDGRFIMMFPQTPREGADVAAERVRQSVRDLLGARDESVGVQAMGTPDDFEEMRDFMETLELREPEPVCADRREPAGD